MWILALMHSIPPSLLPVLLLNNVLRKMNQCLLVVRNMNLINQSKNLSFLNSVSFFTIRIHIACLPNHKNPYSLLTRTSHDVAFLKIVVIFLSYWYIKLSIIA